MILVSACLLGINARYDRGSHFQALLVKHSNLGRFLPVCPEQLGGLSTPRSPAEIIDGTGDEVLAGHKKVISRAGEDVSAAFIRGAWEIKKIARVFPITAAILKERSPSCGVSRIYDGSFTHSVKAGQGVTAALLQTLNIPVYSDEVITEELLQELLDRDQTRP